MTKLILILTDEIFLDDTRLDSICPHANFEFGHARSHVANERSAPPRRPDPVTELGFPNNLRMLQ